MVGGSNPPSATSPHPLDDLADALARGAARAAVPAEAPVVLAVSGGADSMALLHAAARLVARGDLLSPLTVAHLDHALRADSAADARFVADAADRLRLAFVSRRVDVGERARSGGVSIEEAGRAARYAFLDEVAAALGVEALVATAHTADDAAETVLINLLRGSGTSGVRGIPARRGRIVRPLLETRRAALRAALAAAGVAWREDPTNEDPAHLRNRVRAEVLPLLEALRPGAVDAMARFARLAGDDDALLDALADAELDRRRTPDGGIDWHDPPTRALGRRVLRRALGEPAPSAERIEALLDAAQGPRGGLVIELGGGRRASVSDRTVRLE